jgi:hypothetical protein
VKQSPANTDMNMEGEEAMVLENRYQATTGEDTVDCEDLVGAVVNCRV